MLLIDEAKLVLRYDEQHASHNYQVKKIIGECLCNGTFNSHALGPGPNLKLFRGTISRSQNAA